MDEECRKADLEEVFMKYGPLKEIWLASYAPYYAFVVYRDRMDAQVHSPMVYNEPIDFVPRMPVRERMVSGLLVGG